MLPLEPNNKPQTLAQPLAPAAESSHPTLLLGPPTPAADAAPAGPPGLAAPPTLGTLLSALRRRWLLALGVAVVGTAATVALLCFLVPARYVTEARVKLTLNPRNPLLTGYGVTHHNDASIWKANQEGILKGRMVLTRALDSPRVKGLAVAQEPVEWLEKALKVDYLLGPEIMRITLSGDEAEGLAPLLNAVVDSYLDEIHQQEAGKRADVLRQLEESQQGHQRKLYLAEGDLRKEEAALQIDRPEVWKAKYDHAQQVWSKTAADRQTYLADLAGKQKALAALTEREKNLSAEPVSSFQLERQLQEHPLVKITLKELEQLDLLIKEYEKAGQGGQVERAVANLRSDREKMVRGYEATARVLRPGIEAKLREELRATMRSDMARLRGEIEALEFQAKHAADAVKRAEDQVKKLDPANQPRTPVLEKLRNDVDQAREALAKLNKEINGLKVEPTADPRAVRLQSANVPTERDHSRQLKVAGAGGVGVFGLLLFGVAFWEFRSRKVNSAGEVARGLGLGLVGTVPALPARVRRPAKGTPTQRDLHWQSMVTESIDSIRTMILHHARADGLQVVMITSALGGEGKTSVASQLAASLARAWRKTLLVDGDLRNPAAQRLFDVPAEPGLSEVLRGEATLDDAIRPTALSRLWVVPAGHWDSHAVQALAQDGVRQLFARLKEQYDFIVVDSCPVLPVADSLLLAQHVDAVVFSVLKDVSRLPAVHAAHQKLSTLGVRTLGAVVIGDGAAATYRYPA